MILSLFIVLLALSFALVVLGYYSDEDYYLLTGFLFLFLLGTYLLSGLGGGLDVQTGENTTTSYSYFPDNATINQTVAVTEYSYEEQTQRTFGFFLSIVAAFAFIITLLNIRKERMD